VLFYCDGFAFARNFHTGSAGSRTGTAVACRFLKTAEKMADFFLDHPNLPDDGVPYWDFNVGPKQSKKYLQAAEKMLRSLSSARYRAEPGQNGGFLLMHASGGVPGNAEVDVPLSYADYYYAEALMRYRLLHRK